MGADMTERKKALTDCLHEIEAGTWPGDVACVIGGIGNTQIFRAFHGSLDAAKALHEAVLPGFGWKVGAGAVLVYKLNGLPMSEPIAVKSTPARAWLIAIIEALIAMEKDNA